MRRVTQFFGEAVLVILATGPVAYAGGSRSGAAVSRTGPYGTTVQAGTRGGVYAGPGRRAVAGGVHGVKVTGPEGNTYAHGGVGGVAAGSRGVAAAGARGTAVTGPADTVAAGARGAAWSGYARSVAYSRGGSPQLCGEGASPPDVSTAVARAFGLWSSGLPNR